MSKLAYMLIAVALCAGHVCAEEQPWTVYTEWPFDAAEAKRRQKETAEALGVPVMKTITIGKDAKGAPVTMDFMLIPAGRFVMGVPEPVKPVPPVDDRWIGIIPLVLGILGLLAIELIHTERMIAAWRLPQVSLAALLTGMVLVGLVVMGWSRVKRYDQEVRAYGEAMARYKIALEKFNVSPQLHPAHTVTINRPFYMGQMEVTQAQWQAVMGSSASVFSGSRRPVEAVNWDDCKMFLKKLTGVRARLPSEAEWEYACRAGTQTRFYSDAYRDALDEYAWHGENSALKSHPVAQKGANSWSLHDMLGNVSEWVEDTWHDDYENAPKVGSAWTEGDDALRVMRGGSWGSNPTLCQSVLRSRNHPDYRTGNLGFRIVLAISVRALDVTITPHPPQPAAAESGSRSSP